MVHVKPHIAEMARYRPPWANLERSDYLCLDLNENVQGAPDHVIQALKRYLDKKRLQMYPDYRSFLPKLARYVETDEDRLILTNGSDQGIEIALRAFLGPGDTMVIARPEFPIFTQTARIIGAAVRGVSFDEKMQFPYDSFLEAITSDVSLVVVINPNNPTGTPVSLSQIEEILKKSGDIPVIVDEAYYEYTGVTAAGFMEQYPNLIVARTFSKAFAMAGLRLGYLIAHPEIIAELNKIRGPFDINSCAPIAAEAQIDSPEQWKQYIHEVMCIAKPEMEEFFRQNGVSYFPGAAHFMLVKPADRDGAVQYLKDHGILVRPMVADLISDTFRVTVGTSSQTRKFIEVYGAYLRSIAT